MSLQNNMRISVYDTAWITPTLYGSTAFVSRGSVNGVLYEATTQVYFVQLGARLG